MTPDRYCHNTVTKSSSSFRLSFLLLSPPRRRAITALYAFCREVDDIVDEALPTPQARAQLQQWRQEITHLYAGHPSHPITQALQPFITQYQLPQHHFEAIIDGMEMDIEPHPYQGFDDLYRYCYQVAGVVGLLSARIFSPPSAAIDHYAEALGIALQLTNILRDIGEDWQRGRIYIPQQWMDQFGVNPTELSHQPTSAAQLRLFNYLAQQAQHYYATAATALPVAARRDQLSGLVMGETYYTLLQQIRREGYPVLQRRVVLSPLRKIGCVVTTLLPRTRLSWRN